jgi:hypothetical protein
VLDPQALKACVDVLGADEVTSLASHRLGDADALRTPSAVAAGARMVQAGVALVGSAEFSKVSKAALVLAIDRSERNLETLVAYGVVRKPTHVHNPLWWPTAARACETARGCGEQLGRAPVPTPRTLRTLYKLRKRSAQRAAREPENRPARRCAYLRTLNQYAQMVVRRMPGPIEDDQRQLWISLVRAIASGHATATLGGAELTRGCEEWDNDTDEIHSG